MGFTAWFNNQGMARKLGFGFAPIGLIFLLCMGLEQRALSSAQEIKGVVSSSAQTATNAGKLINEIVPQIQKTAELVHEIDVASNEQARGIEENSRVIEQFDQVIQANSAAGEKRGCTFG